MKSTARLLVALAAASLFLALPASGADSALAPLAAIAKHLDDGIAGVFAGKAPAEAFQPWKDGTKPEDLEKVRTALKEAGAASAVSGAMELEVYLEKDGKQVYRIRTQVWTGGGEPCFAGVEGEAVAEEPMVKFHPVADFQGDSKAFGDSAKAVVAALQGEGWKSLPWADPEALRKAIGFEGAVKDLEKRVKESKDGVAKVAEAVAQIASPTLVVRIDDQVFLLKDSSGKAVGILKAQFELGSGGSLIHSFGRVRPFPK